MLCVLRAYLDSVADVVSVEGLLDDGLRQLVKVGARHQIIESLQQPELILLAFTGVPAPRLHCVLVRV